MMRNRPMTQAERLAVVEERMDVFADGLADVNGKLDRLLQLSHERAGSIDAVKTSVERLQFGYGRLKEDTEVIRASMTFARVMRRLVLWGTPLVAAILWITERYDLIVRLFRR